MHFCILRNSLHYEVSLQKFVSVQSRFALAYYNECLDLIEHFSSNMKTRCTLLTNSR
jgi:hypothetical protein